MDDSGDEDFYALAGAELVKNPNQGLLVKCGTKFPNDANKAKAEYIKIRVEQLKAEEEQETQEMALEAWHLEEDLRREEIKEEQEAIMKDVLEFESKFRIVKILPRNTIRHWLCLFLSFALVIFFLTYVTDTGFSDVGVRVFLSMLFAQGVTIIFLDFCPGYCRYWENLHRIKK